MTSDNKESKMIEVPESEIVAIREWYINRFNEIPTHPIAAITDRLGRKTWAPSRELVTAYRKAFTHLSVIGAVRHLRRLHELGLKIEIVNKECTEDCGLSHDCSHCGTPDEVCNDYVSKKGKACCSNCHLYDTHKMIEHP